MKRLIISNNGINLDYHHATYFINLNRLQSIINTLAIEKRVAYICYN